MEREDEKSEKRKHEGLASTRFRKGEEVKDLDFCDSLNSTEDMNIRMRLMIKRGLKNLKWGVCFACVRNLDLGFFSQVNYWVCGAF